MPLPLLQSQRDALPWLVSKTHGLYGAGMGLGKTRSVLEMFQVRRLFGEVSNMIIFAPKRVATLTWPEEIETWAPHLKYRVLPRDGWEWDGSDIYVLNYEQGHKLMKLIRATKNCPANQIVLDECDCAKSPSAKRIQEIRPLLVRAKYVLGMTGTPTANGYHDLYGQFKAIFWKRSPWSSLEKFEGDYFTKNEYTRRIKFRKEKTGLFLEEIRPFMMTQKSSDYLDLPDIEYKDVMVTLPKPLMGKYLELRKELIADIDDKEITAASAEVLVNKLLQFTSGRVFDEDRDIAEVHNLKLKAIQKIKERPLLVLRNYTHTKVPGAVPFSDEILPAWNKKQIPIMIGHPKSMGVGLNLQKGGNTICWHTPTYSLRDTQQAEARLWRTGQTEPVTVYRILCAGTVDEAVVGALQFKDSDQDSLMTALKFIRSQ